MNENPSLRTQREAAARARAAKVLALNETLLWCGRPVPAFGFRQNWITVVFGLVWSIVTAALFTQALPQTWRGWAEGAKTLAGALGETAFAVPFVAIGIGLLLSPVWNWLAMAARVYAVTDQRALVVGRFSTSSWRPVEFTDIGRTDWRNGLTDLWFAVRWTNNGGPRPAGFENLPPPEADAAMAALERLAGRDA